MNKIFCGILSVVFWCTFCIFPASAATSKSNDDYTLGEIQDILLQYFENQDISIELDSYEYQSYLLDQMMFNADDTLAQHPQYELIKDYAASYLNAVNDTQESIPGQSLIHSLKIDTKTIAQIKQEVIEEENRIQSEGTNPTPRYSYNRTNAIAYARQWANGRNPAYRSWSSDCTNFVSQCLAAGGISQNAPYPFPQGIVSTSSYWYYGSAGSMSTSWMQVADFNSYWSRHASIYNYALVSTAISRMSGGDAVLLRHTSTGVAYHAIFITYSNGSSATYCGHTNNAYDKSVGGIDDASNDWTVIKF